MKFCKNCGYGLDESVTVCTHCQHDMDAANTLSDNKLKELSKRIQLNGIIWLVISIMQIVSVVGLPVGVLNLISSLRDLKTSKTVFKYRVGLVNAYKPMVIPIIFLIINFFCGIVGVVASLYYIFFVRGYVMENQEYFNTLK